MWLRWQTQLHVAKPVPVLVQPSDVYPTLHPRHLDDSIQSNNFVIQPRDVPRAISAQGRGPISEPTIFFRVVMHRLEANHKVRLRNIDFHVLQGHFPQDKTEVCCCVQLWQHAEALFAHLFAQAISFRSDSAFPDCNRWTFHHVRTLQLNLCWISHHISMVQRACEQRWCWDWDVDFCAHWG